MEARIEMRRNPVAIHSSTAVDVAPRRRAVVVGNVAGAAFAGYLLLPNLLLPRVPFWFPPTLCSH